MKPNKIFIVRHGQSIGNVDKRVYKELPDYALRLTDLGRQQAFEAGTVIRREIENESVAIYYSPFFRTIETLNNINKAFPEDHLKSFNFVYEDPRIREQEWHGKLPKEGLDQDSEDERDDYGHFYYRFHGGESCADVYDRVSDFVSALHRDFEKPNYPKNTIIVTHGMTMRVLIAKWFHQPVYEFETYANPNNCEVWKLQKNVYNKYDFDISKIRRHVLKHKHYFKLDI